MKGVGSVLVSLLLLAVIFVSLSLGDVQITQAAGPLPPTHLVVQNDDHVARVSWTASTDNPVVGYKVTWGVTGTLNKVIFTGYTVVNIQPLADGTVYQVVIQSVDGNGALSTMLGPGNAQTDPTYVNSVRAKSTAQFDDFNSGNPLDPTHWFASYNNADPSSRMFPVSSQQHWHFFTKNLAVTGHTLRATDTLRALQLFDFTNRTGTVYFDFDWGVPPEPIQGVLSDRYNWYLTISPTLADDISYRAGPSPDVTYPGDLFQILMKAGRIEFRKFVGGKLVHSWVNSKVPASLRTINVRKHSVFKLSQDSASLTIDGVTILNVTGIHLDFQVGYVYFQQLLYQTTKDHIPYVLSHWDNIGFDAPAGYAPDVIHTYTDGSTVNSDEQTKMPASFTVNIPDVLTGAKAERLFMDVETDTSHVPAKVKVNGVSVPWVTVGPSDTQAFDAHVMSMPVGTLHTGNNVISVNTSCGCEFRVENVHVEVAFPHGSTAPYTAYARDLEQKIPNVAPMPGFGPHAPTSGSTVHGTIQVEVTADGMYALLPTGHVDAVEKLEIDVDGVAVVTFDLAAPTVQTDQVLSLDTTKLSNGSHAITVRAYGADAVSMSSNDPILQNDGTPSYNYRTVTVSN